jgi:hypothetical protein
MALGATSTLTRMIFAISPVSMRPSLLMSYILNAHFSFACISLPVKHESQNLE